MSTAKDWDLLLRNPAVPNIVYQMVSSTPTPDTRATNTYGNVRMVPSMCGATIGFPLINVASFLAKLHVMQENLVRFCAPGLLPPCRKFAEVLPACASRQGGYNKIENKIEEG